MILMCKTAGYMVWLEFSIADLAEMKLIIAGVLMFIFAVIDACTFTFYPLEAGIFIDV
jgi:hypothetical protein